MSNVVPHSSLITLYKQHPVIFEIITKEVTLNKQLIVVEHPWHAIQVMQYQAKSNRLMRIAASVALNKQFVFVVDGWRDASASKQCRREMYGRQL